MSATTITLTGNSSDNTLVNSGPGFFEAQINAFEGNDTVLLNGDYVESFIGLDGDNDVLLVGDTGPGTSFFVASTVFAGNGQDTLVFLTTTFENNFISLDQGDDRLFLSSSIVKFPPGATIAGNTMLGGTGTDAIIVDNTVRRFNSNIVELGDNSNSNFGAALNFVTDALLAGDLGTKLVDREQRGPVFEYAYVAATEVDRSTIRGGQGTDIIVLESVTGSPEPAVNGGQDLAISRTLINGNKDDDIFVIARNVANATSIYGGQGSDSFFLVSGTFESSRVNGNLGADTMIFAAIETNRATFLGGQGDDTFNVNSATIFASKIEGNLGDDDINFLAAVSSNTSLLGGNGNDQIDDFSTAIASIGNLLDGGQGNDVLRQASNIASSISDGLLNGVFDYAATFVGGTGADVMTGDLATQPLTGKRLTPGEADVEGASSDTFRFSFGDSDITTSVSRRDTITDFDSNASRYVRNGVDPFNNVLNPFLDFANPNEVAAVLPPVDFLTLQRERDIIELTDTDIVINNTGASLSVAGVPLTFSINGLGRVTDGVSNIQQFVQLGSSLTTAGAAILWEETSLTTPPRSQLFISNGNGLLDSDDLLIQLDQVAGFIGNDGGLRISNGAISDITYLAA